jgi:hypothetical protein
MTMPKKSDEEAKLEAERAELEQKQAQERAEKDAAAGRVPVQPFEGTVGSNPPVPGEVEADMGLQVVDESATPEARERVAKARDKADK